MRLLSFSLGADYRESASVCYYSRRTTSDLEENSRYALHFDSLFKANLHLLADLCQMCHIVTIVFQADDSCVTSVTPGFHTCNFLVTQPDLRCSTLKSASIVDASLRFSRPVAAGCGHFKRTTNNQGNSTAIPMKTQYQKAIQQTGTPP